MKRLSVGVLAFTAASIGLMGCQRINKPRVGAAMAAEPIEASAVDTNAQLDQYLNDTITITGDIKERFTTDSFIISDNGLFGGEEILVINDTGENFAFPDDTISVRATGEVKRFFVTDLDTRINWDLTIDRLKTYEGKPVIMASSIHAAPAIEEVADNPTEFYGQDISLQGQVGRIVSLNSFMLRENELIDEEAVLVIDLTNKDAASSGEVVAVSGQLRPFIVTEINEEFQLGWDLDLQRKLEVELTNKPVLIADELVREADSSNN
ncbi:hypothetical protein [Thalassoporum mexicanum]|uniref:hypothetical protein n=1 Tax=Thalassoporum mexicanum TaxID=3457544 RepID=UPI00090052C0|nr:hypothetical protein [Pseudanabaena sp. PCC 7367]